ncbi:hypothetical protein ONZ45_g297 [Pleurotus djamor]|nr:hypothetical protein ONZ45_g297 [Pleurotus djamor]
MASWLPNAVGKFLWNTGLQYTSKIDLSKCSGGTSTRERSYNPIAVPLLYSSHRRGNDSGESAYDDSRGSANEGPDMARCWQLLNMTSRTYAIAIDRLPGDLRRTVCLLYLVLRGLDTIEDDMTLDLERVKLPMLRSFSENITVPGWNFSGSGPYEKDRQLLVEFDVVIRELERLNPCSRKIIHDTCHDMAYGMAEFCKKRLDPGIAVVETLEDLDLYSYYVAGLVGRAVSRLFAASGYERHWIRDQDVLANSWWLFLQKVNILHDCRVDLDDSRPEELSDPTKENDALQVLNEMVVEALSHAIDVLAYLSLLRNPQVFEFAALPVVLAMLTAKACFMNPAVFRGEVGPSKQEYLSEVARLGGIDYVVKVFSDSMKVIHSRVCASDPNYKRISNIKSEIDSCY